MFIGTVLMRMLVTGRAEDKSEADFTGKLIKVRIKTDIKSHLRN